MIHHRSVFQTSESSSESESDNKEKKIGRKERKASVQGISHSDSEEKDLCKKRKLHEELSGSHHNQEKAKEKLSNVKLKTLNVHKGHVRLFPKQFSLWDRVGAIWSPSVKEQMVECAGGTACCTNHS
ncbi:hypothetical protein H8959_021208 [Pygathrix nigripes]